MCIAFPGKILSIYEDHGTKMAKVDFGGVTREACIEVIDDAKPGDWTIVHAGFALNLLIEDEALATLEILQEMAEFSGKDNLLEGD